MSAPTAATTPTTVSNRVDWAPVPKVNLLPPEIVEGRQFARRQRLLGAVVVATVLSCGGAVFYVQGQVNVAQDELAIEQSRTQQLTTEKAKYDEVPRTLAQVRSAETAREVAMATDVPWYTFLNDLALSTPNQVWLDSVAVSVPALNGTAAPAAGADALAAAGIGTVTATGTAGDFPTVAAWLEGLDQVSGVDDTRFSQAQRSNGESAPDLVTFSSTGGVTPDALSHRYDREAD